MLVANHKSFRPNLVKLFEKLQLPVLEDWNAFQPTLENLILLHKKFLFTFPFENLNLHLKEMRVTDDNGSRVDIHPTVVEKKLLENHRGGYCFEVNQYLHYVLRTLGYHVTPITARVVWMAPPDKQAFRSHVINLVTFAPTEEKPIFNQYICDVSFGSPSFVAPLCVHETMLGISQPILLL